MNLRHAVIAVALTSTLLACKLPRSSRGDAGVGGAPSSSSASTAVSDDASSFVSSDASAATDGAAADTSDASTSATITTAEVGGECTGTHGACSPDKRATLACKGGKLVVGRACKGPKGCAMNGAQVVCDGEMPGDPCSNEGGGWCSADRHMMMVCKGGHFIADNSCRGPGGCAVQGTKVKCDESVALPGDPCDTAGEMTCSVDKKMSLRCGGGHYAKAQDCSTKPCMRLVGMIGCD